jgi:dienelactone hydrolase
MAKEKKPPAMPPLEKMIRLPVVYAIPGMDAARVLEDIVYKTAEQPNGTIELKMDLYLPSSPPLVPGFPVIVFLSGGGVENPDWRKADVYKTYGRLAAAQGFAGVMYQKRYGQGPGSLMTGRDDTADLMRFLREHAADYGFDPDRLAVWAFSAGGLLLGPLLADGPPFLRAALNFYALSDALPAMGEASAHAASMPPLFVARAGLDDPGLNAGLDAFVQEAFRRNADIEVMNHAQGRHGFDVLNDDARSREIIARAFEFLKMHLAGKPEPRRST